MLSPGSDPKDGAVDPEELDKFTDPEALCVNADDLMSIKKGDTFHVRRGSGQADSIGEQAAADDTTAANSIHELRIRRKAGIRRRRPSRVSQEQDVAYLTVKEIVETEAAFVSRLEVLCQVQERNRSVKAVSEDVLKRMFPNLTSIYEFHKQYFLPRLQQRLAEWNSCAKIGDVFRQSTVFLKQYGDYMKGMGTGRELFLEWTKKSAKFAAMVQEIQQQPASENLPLETHMMEPIQRLPRYQLLLERYTRHLPKDSPDAEDAAGALEMVKGVTDKINYAMFKRDNHKSTLKAYQKIEGSMPDSQVTRTLVKEGPATYVNGNTEELHQVYLFLFTDVMLLCDEGRRQKYTVREELHLADMEMREGDNRTQKNRLLLLAKDNVFELHDETPEGRSAGWIQEFKKLLLRHANQRRESLHTGGDIKMDYFRMPSIFLGRWQPRLLPKNITVGCHSCHLPFSDMGVRNQCAACGMVLCVSCSRTSSIPYREYSQGTVCIDCHTELSEINAQSHDPQDIERPPV